MQVAALFLHNMGQPSPGWHFSEYGADPTEEEKAKIAEIMGKIGVKEAMFSGFNTWIFFKSRAGRHPFSVKMFSWESFGFRGDLEEIEKMILEKFVD